MSESDPLKIVERCPSANKSPAAVLRVMCTYSYTAIFFKGLFLPEESVSRISKAPDSVYHNVMSTERCIQTITVHMDKKRTKNTA
jgi:hypothetical protein